RHAPVIIAGQQRVEPDADIQSFADRGDKVVLCEGGPSLLGEFLTAGRLDDFCLSIAPLIGGDNLPVMLTPQGREILHFTLQNVMAEEHTLFLRYEATREEG